jgi:gamma-glutamylputrescine oxidase
MLSYWDDKLLHFDVIIVGAGIVGTTAALHLQAMNPKQHIAVIDADLIPQGASTKNAGFACFGSLTELLADEAQNGTDAVLALVKMRYEGLGMLRALVKDPNMRYQQVGGYELLTTEVQLQALQHLDRWNQLLKPIVGPNVFQVADAEIAKLGLHTQTVKSLVFNSYEGCLHPGLMMRVLRRRAARLGVEFIHGFRVDQMEENPDHVQLIDHNQPAIRFTASQVLLATNGYTAQLLPQLDVKPARGQILLTEPIKGLKLKGTFHSEAGYYYFREIDKRVLLGGARHLDVTTETTTELAVTPKLQGHLEEFLRQVIIPEHPEVKIEQRWAGIMGFGTNTKLPIVERTSPRITLAVRLGGMGVAIGAEVGHQAALLLG